MILDFLKYILQQNQSSLMSKFFKAQCNKPSKGDWVGNVIQILHSIKLEMSFDEKRQMKQNAFKKIVNSKVREVAFKYLLTKIKSKGKEITFGTKLQC